jgi:hypothetical protein
MKGTWKQYNDQGNVVGSVKFKFIEFQKAEIIKSEGDVNFIIKLFEEYSL